jgi:hypothetical protein
MTQAIEPTQKRIGEFPDQAAAENALNALQEAGFSKERISIVPKTPPVPATEAKRSGVRGAIAGALCGGLAGLTLSLMKIGAAGGIPQVDPLRNMLGLFLAGSLIGAVGMGLIGAMTGVNVRKDGVGAEASALIPNFVLFAKDLLPDELSQAKEIVQRSGGKILE